MTNLITEWKELNTPEKRCEWIINQARRWGYDKELLTLIGIVIFNDRNTPEKKTKALNSFMERFKLLSASQKPLLLMSFKGYMKQICFNNPEFYQAMEEFVKEIEEFVVKGDSNES